MEIKERKIKGVFEITLAPLGDERGFFMRTYDINIFREHDLHREWVQENHSRSEKKHIIRGLHFQLPPYTETKLIRCINGTVLDVFVDLRKGSGTFGLWDAIELSEENKKMVYLPRGLAHGFCTLTNVSEVIYKVDNFYSREKERGLLWNDKQLGIQWPCKDPLLSVKDRGNMSLDEFIGEYGGIDI